MNRCYLSVSTLALLLSSAHAFSADKPVSPKLPPAPTVPQLVPVVPVVPVGLVYQGASKITSTTIASADVLDEQNLEITVAGAGKACNYYLTIKNTDSKAEWSFPKVSTFPAHDKISFPLTDAQYVHGSYELTTKARVNDVRPGVSCEGGGNVVAFKKVRRAIKLAADTPQIVDVTIEPTKKMDGVNRYRTDEQLSFVVVGNVENKDPKDAAKRCGWTAYLMDSAGTKTILGKGNQFGVLTVGAPMTSLPMGGYTFAVHTTAADDSPSTMGCLGGFKKQVDVFGKPGVITGIGLKGDGWAFNAIVEKGTVVVTPKIDGRQCTYRLITRVDHGPAQTQYLLHPTGGPIALPMEVYPHDETYVDYVIEGKSSGNSFEGGPCEGWAKGSITVYDRPGKQAIVH